MNPNLVVDDEHRTWNITIKAIQLRRPGGATVDLKTADMVSRKKGDNSLMLENLRDIIGYIRSVASQQK